MPRHPNEALFEGEKPFPIIATCEHFAGTEERISKAFQLQEQMHAVFDITMDCEDGAPTGAEKQHWEIPERPLAVSITPDGGTVALALLDRLLLREFSAGDERAVRGASPVAAAVRR